MFNHYKIFLTMSYEIKLKENGIYYILKSEYEEI